MLKIYNSISQKKNIFVPIEENKVKLYTCGMTIYDYCHLGHALQMIVFDVIVRYLRYRGYEVDFVRNITNIDDKIINRANEIGEDIFTLSSRFIDAMHEDEISLNALRPDKEPKATEHIPNIIKMITTLLDKDYAYIGDNGDVYYDVRKFKTYGELAQQDLDEMQTGTRVEVNSAKHSPLDFVLWKIAKPSEPSWDSPWGAGRPGWHIECSAMSTEVLGNHFDIHGGGLDLKFPHHQNEIAQSEAATGEKFANTWMHTGLIQVDDEKMSKSLHNFTTIREALAEYSPEVIRYFMVSSHYRSPLNYSSANMQTAKAALQRFYTALRDLPVATEIDNNDYEARFVEAMDDDFNTPEALAILFDLTREINRLKGNDLQQTAALGSLLKRLAGILGLLQDNPENFLQASNDNTIGKAEVEALITQRNAARANKDWAESDRIRDELLAQGISLEDSATSTTWRKI